MAATLKTYTGFLFFQGNQFSFLPREKAAAVERGKNGEVSENQQSRNRSTRTIRREESCDSENFDDGTRERPYGHCLVAGIKEYPSKVIKKDSAKKTAKKSRVKAFFKVVNYQHLMPTRYTLDVDLKDVVVPDSLVSKDKKVTTLKETIKRFEERFKTGKNRWFFTKLRF